jgi:hypothetical protein
MQGGESGRTGERVREALVRLGADSASAPQVPDSVTARIAAALRAAPPTPAHTTAQPRPSRLRIIALSVGIVAAAAAVVIALGLLLQAPSESRLPSGPTAEKMTAPTTPADTSKAVVTPP